MNEIQAYLEYTDAKIITMWNKCMGVGVIANQLGVHESYVEMVIDNPANYGNIKHEYVELDFSSDKRFGEYKYTLSSSGTDLEATARLADAIREVLIEEPDDVGV